MKDRKLLRAIEGARKGDDEAFNRLMELRGKNLLYIAMKLMKDPKDGEDAAQEAALIIRQKIHSLQNAEFFDTWMYRIVFNVCMGEKRGDQAAPEFSDIAEYAEDLAESRSDFLPGAYLDAEANRQELLAAVDRLPKSYRMCLLMYYYENMSYAQIADVMEVKVQDVANMLNRAKKKLQLSLAEPAAEEPGSYHEADFGSTFASGSRLGGVPALTILFGYDEKNVVTPDALTRFNAAVMVASATAAKSAPPAILGSLALRIIAGLVSLALVGGIGFAFLQGWSPVDALGSLIGGATPTAPHNAQEVQPVETAEEFWETQGQTVPLSAVMPEEEAAVIEGFSQGGHAKEDWDEIVDRLGLEYHSHFLSEGSKYTVYTYSDDKTGLRAVLIEKSDDANSVEVVHSVGKAGDVLPEGIDSVTAFDSWRK